MFGRVRRRTCPSQDSEFHSSKLLKHDSFSVYECTVLKLKLGSQRSPCSPVVEISLANVGSLPDSLPTCMDIDSTPPNCLVNFREGFNPGESSSATTSDSPSPVILEQPTTWSIPYLFNKYKASHRADDTSKPHS